MDDNADRNILLDHYREPRNLGKLPVPPATHVTFFDPVCGDEVEVYVNVDDDGVVADIRIGGAGCSISQSSASLMSEQVAGRTVGEVSALAAAFWAMLSDNDDLDADPQVDLGDLEALRGAVKFPVRVKCAKVGWRALLEALGRPEPEDDPEPPEVAT